MTHGTPPAGAVFHAATIYACFEGSGKGLRVASLQRRSDHGREKQKTADVWCCTAAFIFAGSIRINIDRDGSFAARYLSHPTLCVGWGTRLLQGSDVESEEPCIHPGILETTGARLLLRRFPLLSRQNRHEQDDHGYRNTYEDSYE